MELSCPKCQGPMRSYERNRVVIDQCVECRGIFLDRGELEALLDAEAAYYEPMAPAAPVAVPSLPAAAGDAYLEPMTRRVQPALRIVPPPAASVAGAAPSWGGDDAYAEDVTFDMRFDPGASRTADEPRRRRGSFLRELFE